MKLRFSVYFCFLFSIHYAIAAELHFRLKSGTDVAVYIPAGWTLSEIIQHGVEISYQLFPTTQEEKDKLLDLEQSGILDCAVFEEIIQQYFNEQQGSPYIDFNDASSLFQEPIYVAIGGSENTWTQDANPQIFQGPVLQITQKYPCCFCSCSFKGLKKRADHINKNHLDKKKKYQKLDENHDKIPCPDSDCNFEGKDSQALFQHWSIYHRGALLPVRPTY